MSINRKRAEALFIKYRENRCTRAEFEELIHLAQIIDQQAYLKELLEDDWNKNRKAGPNLKPVRKNPGRNLPGWVKIAACLMVLLGAGLAVYQLQPNGQIAYATGDGEVLEFTLPDGSEVMLNANSTLRWRGGRSPEQSRKVELLGEAFFKVAKAPVLKENTARVSRLFQVVTPELTVSVLGTSFNVISREAASSVYLDEGTVEIKIRDKSTHTLVPGDKLSFDARRDTLISSRSETRASSASWTKGVLNYRDLTFKEVLQNLSVLFGKELRCGDKKLMERRIDLGVPYKDWENTRKALEMVLPIRFENKGTYFEVIALPDKAQDGKG